MKSKLNFFSLFLLISLSIALRSKDQSKLLPLVSSSTAECPIGCSECTNSTYCTKCFEQWFFQKNTCQHCPDNCAICKNSTSCSNCLKSYYLTSKLTCDSCSSNCDECSNHGKECTKCSKLYFLNKDECKPCINGCEICKNNSTCEKPYPGFFYMSSKTNITIQKIFAPWFCNYL